MLSPDAGQGNQMVALFAIYIDVTDNEDDIIRTLKEKRIGAGRFKSDVEIFPISELMGFVSKTPDAYILSIISRCLSMKLVDVS